MSLCVMRGRKPLIAVASPKSTEPTVSPLSIQDWTEKLSEYNIRVSVAVRGAR